MASKKEALYIVLDVSPTMHPYLPYAGRALATMVEAKILYQSDHQVAVILVGSTGTANPLQELGGYDHITLARELSPPDLETLRLLRLPPKGQGTADVVGALLVTLDSAVRELRDNVRFRGVAAARRVLLLSNFLQQPDVDEEALEQIIAAFQGSLDQDGLPSQSSDISLQVVSIDVPGADLQYSEAKRANTDVLDRLAAHVTMHGNSSVKHPADLVGVFKAREYKVTAVAKQNFRIGIAQEDKPLMAIKVKLVKKVSQEKMPAMGRQTKVRPQAGAPEQEIAHDKEYLVEGEERAVAAEDTLAAYRYGKKLVPISSDDKAQLVYSPSSDMTLIGFLPKGSVPRQHFMKDAELAVPDKDAALSYKALSALARAMDKRGCGAVVRIVSRNKVSLRWALPHLGRGTSQPDALVLTDLPWMEDVRIFDFASFDPSSASCRKDLLPTAEHLDVAHKLVKAMDLAPGGAEQLRPESSPNPALHCFYGWTLERALGLNAAAEGQAGGQQEGEEEEGRQQGGPADRDVATVGGLHGVDILAERLLQQRLDSMPGAREVLERLPHVFKAPERPTKPGAGGGGEEALRGPLADQPPPAGPGELLAHGVRGPMGGVAVVDMVGTSTPVEDFKAMMDQGSLEDAFRGMREAVITLVDTSLGDRYYAKALACVEELRAASIKQNKWQEFNSFLRDLCSRYERHPRRMGFWAKLAGERRITLVSSDECDGSGVDPGPAQDWLQQHSGASAGAKVEGEGAEQAVAAGAEGGEARAAPPQQQVAAAEEEEEEDEFADME